MISLLCLLEEPSAKEMLEIVLPKILPETVEIHYAVFEGKQDLEKNIEKRLRYWQKPDTCFLVMRDQDAGDCRVIKKGLVDKIEKSGKSDSALVRIPCHELESFYLGDLQAVEQGLKLRNISKLQGKEKYRCPDRLTNAAEELTKLSDSRYQKIQGARDISPYLKLDGTNKSPSFNTLISGVRKLIDNSIQG